MISSSPAISASVEVPVARDDTELERATLRRVSLRLLPFLFVLFIFNYVDRANVAMAQLQMNRDLGLSATAYGVGYGIFYVGYCLLEVPSNLILARVGARRWIARIAISWGLIASAMTLMRTPAQFYTLRLLLGVAEAGFFPGIVYYLSQWFPAAQRARAMSRFMIAIPLSSAVGNPLAGWLLGLDGSLGLRGWRWVFLVEGIPSVLLGVATLAVLTDSPGQAHWLSDEQRAWLAGRLGRDGDNSAAPHGMPPLRALAQPMVWLVSLTYLTNATMFYGYLSWAPSFVSDMLRVSPTVTGVVTGLIGCLAAVALLASGARSDRTGDRCLNMFAGMGLAALGYLGAALLPNALARVAGLGLVLVGSMTFLAPFWCLPSVLLRGSAAAAAIAFVNSLANVGGIVAPYTIGRLKDVTGSMSGGFLVLAVAPVAGAVLSLLLRRQTVFALSTRAAAHAITPNAVSG